ncbi:hypothetical protein [Pannonibacter tanglangensis]|uniref:Uncharacterized protein n=1 Tax=Pannonibacter tanglangensis TaxID=2750084 RepID=A0ABW9ZM78_9HYPH|nr:hypothetical protein [Pannonibacter sp. XCT-34]NBN64124.1 hypothetical protein [Pannonibacter sp. XCT-34]
MNRTIDYAGLLDGTTLSQIPESAFGYGSWTETVGPAFREGVLDSFGLGTAIRFAGSRIPEMTQGGRRLTQDEYRQSPYFRETIPWDEGMTDTRAAVLAEWADTRAVRQRRLENTETYGVQTIAGLLGQATDPVNYIPVLGPAAKAAAVGKMGLIAGRAALASADAALNTAIAGAVTAPVRSSFGDDTSFERFALEVGSAALIGAVFGGVGGALERRTLGQKLVAQQDASALRNVQTVERALDDSAVSLAETGEVRLPPDIVQQIARVSRRDNPASGDLLFAPLDRGDLFRTTTVGRVEDTRATVVADFEEFLRQRVLSADPALAARYQEAEARFQAAQDAVEAIEAPLAARTDVDTVAMLDPDTADRLRAVDAELAGTPPAARRRQLEIERQALVESFEPGLLARTESDFRIGPNKRAKAARKALANVRREFSAVRREVDAAARRDMTVRQQMFRSKTDPSPGQADPIPQEAIDAGARVGRPVADAKELAAEFKVDAETGEYAEVEEYELALAQGRISPDAVAAFQRADEIFRRTDDYNNALRAAAMCEIG